MPRRYYSSTAAQTTLSAGVNSSTSTMAVTAVSGWPSSFPYTLLVDKDTVNEEIVTVTARTGNTLTVTRGADGTSGVAHSAGANVQHGVSARDFDETNAFVNGTGVVTTALIADSAVTSAKIADGTIVNADINASAAIAQSKIATLTTDLAAKADYALPVDPETGTTYIFTLANARQLVTASNAAASTYTIPPQSSVAWVANTILRIVNYGAGAVTIAGGSGVTVTNATKTLLQFESAALIRTAENAWTLVPFGGVPDLDTAGSRNIQTFTGSTTYTIPQWAKKIDYLIVGGGNSGRGGDNSSAAAGGNGGQVVRGSTTTFTRGGSMTITVGAGGVTVSGLNNFGTGGNSSIVIPGGSTFTATGGGGASGGGISSNGADGTLPTAPFNFAYFGGGGGGAVQSGNAGWITNGGNGGGGLGAMGNFATAGRANTGGGGGGGAFFGGPANGGSGIVLLYIS